MDWFLFVFFHIIPSPYTVVALNYAFLNIHFTCFDASGVFLASLSWFGLVIVHYPLRQAKRYALKWLVLYGFFIAAYLATCYYNNLIWQTFVSGKTPSSSSSLSFYLISSFIMPRSIGLTILLSLCSLLLAPFHLYVLFNIYTSLSGISFVPFLVGMYETKLEFERRRL